MVRSLAVAGLVALSLIALPRIARAEGAVPAVAPTAVQPELSVDEIVKRASAQLEKKPKKLSCTVDFKAAQLDSGGKPKETQESELIETWIDGKDEEGLPTKSSVDGKPLTAAELVKSNEDEKQKRDEMKQHQQEGQGGSVDAPLAAGMVAKHTFALLRRDQYDGRAVYVLSIEPVSKVLNETIVTREGTVMIDAQSFVPLRFETHAMPLPSHVDKMEFDEQFALTAAGETAPKALVLEVKGGFLIFTRTFKVETYWRDCK